MIAKIIQMNNIVDKEGKKHIITLEILKGLGELEYSEIGDLAEISFPLKYEYEDILKEIKEKP